MKDDEDYEVKYKVYERLVRLPVFGYVAVSRCCIPEDTIFDDERFRVRVRNLREEDAVRRYGNYIPKNGVVESKPVGLLGLLFD